MKPVRLPILAAALLIGSTATLKSVDAPAPLLPVPSPSQLAWQEKERLLFVYFGVNTFTGRNIGLGTEPPSLFDPGAFDPRQWTSIARESGFNGLILTAKHYDGFCLWPTATTERSVKNSPWKNGRGDVVRDVADACREAGIGFGVSCAPWDRSQPSYTTNKTAYAKLYRTQLAELLTNYGPLFEVWFDGNRADVDDWPSVMGLVRTLQPGAVIKQGPRLPVIAEDVRWVGNNAAVAPVENWSVYPPPGSPDETRRWFPVECNTLLVGNGFWDGTPPRDLHSLMNNYYTSVGRNSVLVLGVAVNKEGLFSPETGRRLREFHDALRQVFGVDYAAGKAATASHTRGNDPRFGPQNAVDRAKETYWTTDDSTTRAWIEIDLGTEIEFNVVRLEEMIALGQRVTSYQVEAWSNSTRQWTPLSRGATIGHRKLDRFPTVTASRVRLTVLESRACPVIRAIGVHHDTISAPEDFAAREP